MFAFVVAGVVVLLSYQGYFAANLVAPVAKVYVATIKAGASPGAAWQLAIWAVPGPCCNGRAGRSGRWGCCSRRAC